MEYNKCIYLWVTRRNDTSIPGATADAGLLQSGSFWASLFSRRYDDDSAATAISNIDHHPSNRLFLLGLHLLLFFFICSLSPYPIRLSGCLHLDHHHRCSHFPELCFLALILSELARPEPPACADLAIFLTTFFPFFLPINRLNTATR